MQLRQKSICLFSGFLLLGALSNINHGHHRPHRHQKRPYAKTTTAALISVS